MRLRSELSASRQKRLPAKSRVQSRWLAYLFREIYHQNARLEFARQKQVFELCLTVRAYHHFAVAFGLHSPLRAGVFKADDIRHAAATRGDPRKIVALKFLEEDQT